MNTIIEKIRAEVKIRLSANGAFDEEGDSAWHYDQGLNDAYNYILSFLDTLEKEEKPIEGLEEENIFANKDLNKEWEKFIKQEKKENHGDLPCYGDFGVLRIARHFAQWGAEHAREDMMKEAVEGTYNNSDWGTPCIDLPTPLDLERLDKVRIIICKKED